MKYQNIMFLKKTTYDDCLPDGFIGGEKDYKYTI